MSVSLYLCSLLNAVSPILLVDGRAEASRPNPQSVSQVSEPNERSVRLFEIRLRHELAPLRDLPALDAILVAADLQSRLSLQLQPKESLLNRALRNGGMFVGMFRCDAVTGC